MSNRLYVYGDSFAMSYNDSRDWHQLISSALGLKIINEAQAGLGNIQSYERWLSHVNEYKENDIIIIVLTSTERSYFWKNAPSVSQAESLFDEHEHTRYYLEKSLSKNEIKEIYKHKNLLFDYHIHLHNAQNIDFFILSWLNWLDYLSIERKFKACILTAFKELSDVLNYNYKNLLINKYPLLSIETVDKKYQKMFYSFNDLRSCHLMYSNHFRLATSIISALNSGKFVDRTDWLKTFNHTDLLSDEFIEKEFCYNKFNLQNYFPSNNFQSLVSTIRNL